MHQWLSCWCGARVDQPFSPNSIKYYIHSRRPFARYIFICTHPLLSHSSVHNRRHTKNVTLHFDWKSRPAATREFPSRSETGELCRVYSESVDLFDFACQICISALSRARTMGFRDRDTHRHVKNWRKIMTYGRGNYIWNECCLVPIKIALALGLRHRSHNKY